MATIAHASTGASYSAVQSARGQATEKARSAPTEPNGNLRGYGAQSAVQDDANYSNNDSSPNFGALAERMSTLVWHYNEHGPAALTQEELKEVAELCSITGRKLIDAGGMAQQISKSGRTILEGCKVLKKKTFDFHTRAIRAIAPKANYRKRKYDETIPDGYQWLLCSEHVATLAFFNVDLLAKLHQNKTRDQVRVLLAQALWERFHLAHQEALKESRQSTQLDTPRIRREDIVKAASNDWKLPRPAWVSTLVLPTWMEDMAGLPCLPSVWTARLMELDQGRLQCTAHDLCTDMDNTLDALWLRCQQPGGDMKVRVHGLPSPPRLEFSAQKPTEARKLKYETVEDLSNLPNGDRPSCISLIRDYENEESTRDETIAFTFPTEISPPQDAEQWMEKVIQEPPTNPLTYYVVNPREQPGTEQDMSRLQSILHPGMRLEGRRRLDGINTALYFASAEPYTGSALHVEDAELGSLNLLVAGAPKIWLTVPPSESSKVEKLVRLHCKKPNSRALAADRTKCSQAVRHAHVLFAPSTLRKVGIAYRMRVQEADDLIVTAPGAYHQVINMGPSFAEAINHEPKDSPDTRPGYKWCGQRRGQCGNVGLTAKMFSMK